MAAELGWENTPFPYARRLPLDNGERFFSQYITKLFERQQSVTPHFINDRCQCNMCARNTIQLAHSLQPSTEVPINIEEVDIQAGPRVGVDYAEECAAWPWRFYIKNSRWVSKK